MLDVPLTHKDTPNQLFLDLVLAPKPNSVTRLSAHFQPAHEWSAWFHFYASSEDIRIINKSLNVEQLEISSFKKFLIDFKGAPEGFSPPNRLEGDCNILSGVKVAQPIYSVVFVDAKTGETFVHMQHL